jgi:hypothetical protein
MMERQTLAAEPAHMGQCPAQDYMRARRQVSGFALTPFRRNPDRFAAQVNVRSRHASDLTGEAIVRELMGV